MSADPIESRSERLESLLLHLEHQFDSLNRVVLEQERRLTRLEKLCDQLRDRLKTQEINEIRADSGKPPHHVF